MPTTTAGNTLAPMTCKSIFAFEDNRNDNNVTFVTVEHDQTTTSVLNFQCDEETSSKSTVQTTVLLQNVLKRVSSVRAISRMSRASLLQTTLHGVQETG